MALQQALPRLRTHVIIWEHVLEWFWRHFGERTLAWVLPLIGPRVGWAVADSILSCHIMDACLLPMFLSFGADHGGPGFATLADSCLRLSTANTFSFDPHSMSQPVGRTTAGVCCDTLDEPSQ